MTNKVLSYCILHKIEPISERTLEDYQGGFRPNRFAMDVIFIIKLVFQKIWKYNKKVYTLFVDFKKAYDSIHRPSLLNILKEFNFLKKTNQSH